MAPGVATFQLYVAAATVPGNGDLEYGSRNFDHGRSRRRRHFLDDRYDLGRSTRAIPSRSQLGLWTLIASLLAFGALRLKS